MSIKALATLNPLLKTLKKSVRFWIISFLFIWIAFFAICLLGNSHEQMAAGLAIVYLITVVVLYFKNNGRNATLKTTIEDFADIKRVEMFEKSHENLLLFCKMIWILDMTVILWPFTIIFKLVFWAMYRKFKKNVKKLRKMAQKGTKIEGISSEYDPFYEFLMREGLYEEEEMVNEDLNALLETDDFSQMSSPEGGEVVTVEEAVESSASEESKAGDETKGV